ncbi:MAG: heme-binding domain-containing protein [Bacteroidetes bacterium]|nr:heme-binding domain-containing protein [Bacteroidota bacterium]
MKILLKRIALAGAVIAIGAQLFRPDRVNPDSDPALSIRRDPMVTPEILGLLDRSCFDCHTHETRWPWYSTLTPVNYLTVRDVEEGRKHLNLSNWMSQSPTRRASALERMADEITGGSMPLAPYVLMHAEAKWTDAEKQAFLDWAYATQDSLMRPNE